MKKNMGSADRVIRLIIAAIVGVLYYLGILSGIVATVLLVLSGIFILTSLVSSCPIYSIVGISTCKVDKS